MPPTDPKNNARRTIVGVDGSDGSKAALEWALPKTTTFGRIQPVASWQYPAWATGSPAPWNPSPPPREWFEANASRTAREATQGIDPSGCLAPLVVHGHAGRVLCEAASAATLLVVGSRGRSALAEIALGSVSSYCASHATTPVAIIPTDAAEAGLDTVVVGVDGSENSTAALTWVLENVPADAAVEAIHCLAPIGPAFEIVLTYRDTLRERGQEALDDTVERAIARADRAGPLPTVSRSVQIGDPRQVLGERNADLIVVGARGHRGISHLLLGSVATALAHQTKSPTIIVPTPDRSSGVDAHEVGG